jgi:RNA polymerase sigma-70 factor (ECF subfamily)
VGANFPMVEVICNVKGAEKRSRVDDNLPILERILAGDAQAFAEIVERHKVRIYRATFAITGNAEDAEEAMQDAFLKAYRHLGEFHRASRFTTWLTRIAINEGLQLLRRRKPNVSLDDGLANQERIMPKQLQEWHDSPETLYSKRQLRELIEGATQSLTPACREVFVLRDVHGLSTGETAVALGVSISNVKSRVLRARLKMRELLAPHGDAQHAILFLRFFGV